MSREALLTYEPFVFQIGNGTTSFDLTVPTKVSGSAAVQKNPVIYADGHGEQGRDTISERVVIEGVMPFYKNDIRLYDKSKYMNPRLLVLALRTLLKQQTTVLVRCTYLTFSENCVLTAFSWEPVADTEGDIRYQITLDTCHGVTLPPLPQEV